MLLKFISKIEAFMRTRDGATAIEYGLIAAGIAVAISGVVFTFGTELTDMFRGAETKIGAAAAQ